MGGKTRLLAEVLCATLLSLSGLILAEKKGKVSLQQFLSLVLAAFYLSAFLCHVLCHSEECFFLKIGFCKT